MKIAVALSWLLALIGAVIALGALGAMTNDTPGGIKAVEPYRNAWVAWSLEAFGLLVCLGALIVGPYYKWKAAVAACLAVPTAVLIPIANAVDMLKAGLPGANGSEARPNALLAGLIMVFIGNWFIFLTGSLFDDAPAPAAPADAKVGV